RLELLDKIGDPGLATDAFRGGCPCHSGYPSVSPDRTQCFPVGNTLGLLIHRDAGYALAMQTMSEQIIERRPPGWIPADTFSNRLVILRRDLGLTIDEICELIGISPATWSNWERGATPMKLTKI